MKVEKIKKINENMPSWMKKPFAKLIRNRLIHNNVFIIQYENLIQYEKNKNGIQEQLKLLRDTLRYANEYVPYYHNLFRELNFNPENVETIDDMKKIPIMTKDNLRDNYKSLISTEPMDSYTVTTGGTTGEPVRVEMERNTIFKEWAFVYYYWSKYGYNYKTSRLATFRGVDFGKNLWVENPLYQEIRMNPMRMNKENIRKYVNKIDSYGAEFLYGYPSSIYNFCRLCKKAKILLTDKFKAVFLISENLYPFQKVMINRVINAPIATFYGHSERAVFAECDKGKYYFNKIYGVTELSSNGNPIVTGFINRKMPLIRYLVDDQVSKSDGGGYDIIGHRDSEVLYGKNGEQISVATINFHDDTFDGVIAYQFYQKKIGECILRIEVSDTFEKRIKLIQRRLTDKIGMECIVVVVDKIELSNRGKYKMLIQECSYSDDII